MKGVWEKMYNEALELAKEKRDIASRNGADITVKFLEEIFPELAESEDERIRKWLSDILDTVNWRNDWPYTKQQVINYLEKQKEQSMSATEVLARAGLKPYKDGNQWCILAGDNIQEGICGFGDTIDEALYEFLKEVLIMANSPQLKEQKQEWSEKEYGRLFDIEHYLKGTLQLSPDRKIACIDFLKSLRPSWKPSEEQMEALNYAIAEWDGGKKLEGLYSLRNDLKKLM